MPTPIRDKRSPYWQYDFQRNKRRFYGSTGCAKKRDAQKFIDNILRKIALGLSDKPEISLDEACHLYWEDRGRHEESRKTTDYQLANLCNNIGANRLLSEIGLIQFRDFVNTRRESVSNASVNREWELARRVWRYAAKTYSVSAIEWGELKLKESQERIRELRADEEVRLFAKIPESLAPIVEFAILSGQRRSAIIGLRWDRLDWTQGEASIVNKGGGDHSFPLTIRMIELLLEQPKVDDCLFVFTYLCERPAPVRKDRPARRKGVRYPFSAQGWMRKWRKALKDAQIDDFRFHDLRHNDATRMVRRSGNLKAASTLLGHTDIRTTSRYAHVCKDDLREIMTATESRNITGQRLTALGINIEKTDSKEHME